MMTPANDQEVLSGHGLRLFQLYALFGTPSEKWDLDSEETQTALTEHVAFLRDLEASGVMFMGGPFRAPDYEWDGSGMIVVRSSSITVAMACAQRDPLYVRGQRTYEVRGWQLNEGRLQLTVDLDSNRVGLE